jgi:hypothetical protein
MESSFNLPLALKLSNIPQVNEDDIVVAEPSHGSVGIQRFDLTLRSFY